MKVAITGATGLIGRRLVTALLARGDDVTVLSRDPDSARATLAGVDAVGWPDPSASPAPVAALAGRDAVVHLAGEPVAQRWSADVKAADPRVARARDAQPRRRPASRRPRGAARARLLLRRRLLRPARRRARRPRTRRPATTSWPRSASPGSARRWPRGELGLRVVCVRTGVVLDQDGGALEKMLPPFKLGVGGPVAGGGQYMPWIHVDDLVGLYLAALDDAALVAARSTARRPSRSTNRAFSKALGRVAAPPGGRAGARLRDPAALRRDGARSSPRASARCPSARSRSATSSRMPTSSPPCADALGKA